LGTAELMIEAHFLSHCRIFPEGNFVAIDEARVIGLGGGFFIDFDFDHPDHTFLEIIADGYYTNHDPAGVYYYGADISVHPDYRGRGLGRQLYEARKAMVRRHNKRGIVAGGLIPGFAAYKGKLTAEDYVAKVVSGELQDGTLSFQLRNDFVVRGVLQDYIEDSASDNWATLIEWVNLNFAPADSA
jgi:GNAT superfamily N-acetyltransferase